MRTPVITAEEGGDKPGHFRGAVEQEHMTSMPVRVYRLLYLVMIRVSAGWSAGPQPPGWRAFAQHARGTRAGPRFHGDGDLGAGVYRAQDLRVPDEGHLQAAQRRGDAIQVIGVVGGQDEFLQAAARRGDDRQLLACVGRAELAAPQGVSPKSA